MRVTVISTLTLILFATAPVSAEETPTAKPKAPMGAAPAGGGAAPKAKVDKVDKVDWNGMDKKQRKAYMKKVVLPEAQKMFAEFDAQKYKKVTCVTCHGEGAEKDFKMPNPALPKLPATPAGFGALQQKKPEAIKFMATRMKPTIASLLGLPEFIPGHQQGFGCFNCHTKDESMAAPAAVPAPTTGPAKP